MSLRKIKNPMVFQGKMRGREYFEGWYFKQGTKDGKDIIAFIPGISLEESESHSFVQYIYMGLDNNNNRVVKTAYFQYDVGDFSCRDEPFEVKIANNIFTGEMISISLEDQNFNIYGKLQINNITPIKASALMPNIMGFFAYIPRMECYHGVISMNHTVHGTITADGQRIDFIDGKGYIEKDWGTSFPKKYIWIQCNQFEDVNVSVFFSAADIPFMKRSFLGFICNLVIGEDEYRFATYNRSKLTIVHVYDHGAELSLKNSSAELRITASIDSGGTLIAPRRGKMQDTIKEGLSGDITIHLYDKDHKLIYKGNSQMAGIEIVNF